MSSSTISRYRESSDVPTSTQIHNHPHTEEHALHAIAKETELRLQHQREQNHAARQIRCKQLEKNARDDDGNETSPTIPLVPSKPGIYTANSLLLQKFLNGDTDIGSIEKHDLKRLLSELESKYKTCMINNSIIYNEKQALHYQIDSYKDILDEHYETVNQIKREFKQKSTDYDLQKRLLNELQQENNRIKTILINCQNLIQESEQKYSTDSNSNIDESMEEKLQRILNEKYEQFEQITRLKSELDEEKIRLKLLKEHRPIQNQIIHETYDYEQQKQLIKQITDLKNRLQQIEADNGSLQQENKRYEAQLTRYKQQLDEAERVEDQLKQERRQLKPELRAAREELENERLRNDVLQRENERLRTVLRSRFSNADNDRVLSRSNSPLLAVNSNNRRSYSPAEDST